MKKFFFFIETHKYTHLFYSFSWKKTTLDSVLLLTLESTERICSPENQNKAIIRLRFFFSLVLFVIIDYMRILSIVSKPKLHRFFFQHSKRKEKSRNWRDPAFFPCCHSLNTIGIHFNRFFAVFVWWCAQKWYQNSRLRKKTY